MSQTIKHGSEYSSQVKSAYSDGTELAPLSGNSAELVYQGNTALEYAAI